MDSGQPKILFLDQNKWIELAKAKFGSGAIAEKNELFSRLESYVRDGKLIIPLTAANIYETQKRNDPASRKNLAYCQAHLSNGWVFRCGSMQRQLQLRKFFSELTNTVFENRDLQYPLSPFFLDAFAEREKIEDEGAAYNVVLELSKLNPRRAIYGFLAEIPDDARATAVQKYSESSSKLIEEINARIIRLKSENFSTKRRAYQALLAYDFQSLILSEAATFGLGWESFAADNGRLLKRTIEELSYFQIETELSLKLDGRGKGINENHLRDMQNVLVALPNCDWLVLEKEFSSLIQQCGLDKIYRAKVTTKLTEMLDLILFK